MDRLNGSTTLGEMVDILGSSAVQRPVPIADMDDQKKYFYMLVFVSLIMQAGNEDNEKIANLNLLMTRIDCGVEVRKKIRESLDSENTINLDSTLNTLFELINPAHRDGIKISLLKDIIGFYGYSFADKKLEQSVSLVKSNSFINSIISILQIDNKELEVVIEALNFDQSILSGKIKDSELEKMAKDLAAKAGAVGVPIAALYLSGSVLGLSAAGITSALAALGFGGILGLSSMVTGIGTLILIGTVIYQGTKFITGSTERDKTSKRGIMLRYILVEQQKTIANMAEDIFDITITLKKLLVDAAKNQLMIDKIINRMAKIQAAADYIKNKESASQSSLINDFEGKNV